MRRTIQTRRERRAGNAAATIFLRRFSTVINDCLRLISSDTVPRETIDNCVVRLEILERNLRRAHGPILEDEISRDLHGVLDETLDAVRNKAVQEEGTANTGYQAPRTQNGTGGAPRYVISEEQLKGLIQCGFTIKRISTILRVSVNTVKRRMREYGLRIQAEYDTLEDDELDELVRQAVNGNRMIGSEGVRARLYGQGYRIQRARVRQSLLRIDAGGAALRVAPPTQRRTYTVAGPNSLWHIDGNHKLIRWKMVIHGGIDGYSRYLTFLKVSPNNRKETVLQHFLQAAAACGVPSRVRVDAGGENNDVCTMMEFLRGADRGSFIRARSVHNQRIERAWVDVWKGVTNLYYDIFNFFEQEGFLDTDNIAHIWGLHYVFLPRIDRDLQLFRNQWNNHGIRTANHESPLRLFVSGALELMNSGHTAMDDLFQNVASNFNADAGAMVFEEGVEGNRVVVPGVPCPLADDALTELQETVDPLAVSTDMGMDLYMLVRDFIDNHET